MSSTSGAYGFGYQHATLAGSIVALLCVVALCMFGCKKSPTELHPQARWSLPATGEANDVVILDAQHWMVCGGVQLQQGYVTATTDAGNHWNTFVLPYPTSMHCLYMRDSLHGWMGGDQLGLWNTHDGGAHWNFDWLASQVPYNGEDRPPVRSFQCIDSTDVLFCGGENLGSGVVYHSADGGNLWEWQFFRHEFRGLHFTTPTDGVVVGHGADLFTRDGIGGLSLEDNGRQFITSLAPYNGQLWACTYEGTVCTSSDEGVTWNTMYTERNGEAFTDIALGMQRWAAVGTGGSLAVSDDHGATWKPYHVHGEPSFKAVAVYQSLIFATDRSGVLYQFNP
jgi:photosystem II stability/assembly factor-like uncharacterized protein